MIYYWPKNLFHLSIGMIWSLFYFLVVNSSSGILGFWVFWGFWGTLGERFGWTFHALRIVHSNNRGKQQIMFVVLGCADICVVDQWHQCWEQNLWFFFLWIFWVFTRNEECFVIQFVSHSMQMPWDINGSMYPPGAKTMVTYPICLRIASWI